MHLPSLKFQYKQDAKFALDIPELLLDGIQILNIVGNNGSGKSTWAKHLAGLFHKKNHGIKWQYIPQFAEQFLFAQTINEQIKYLFEHDFIREKFASELSDLALPPNDEFMDFPMALMSGGELRRIMLAFAFYSHKKHIILDEPTIGLGLKELLVLLNKINTFSAMGNELIIISHDKTIMDASQHVCAFENGTLLYSQSTEDVKKTSLLDQFIG